MVDFSRPVSFVRPEAFHPSVENSSRYEGKQQSGMFYAPFRKQKKQSSEEEKKNEKKSDNHGIDLMA